MFQDLLNRALEHVDGSIACVLMGFDGIPIASLSRSGKEGKDALMAVAVELAGVLAQVHRANMTRELGGLTELALRTQRLGALAHVVLGEYVLVMTVAPDTDLERAARVLRLVAPGVERQMQ